METTLIPSIQEKCTKMIDLLKKRENERKADLLKDKEERNNFTAENEKIDYFRNSFTEKCDEIRRDLLQSEGMSTFELADHFNNVSKKILTLQKYVSTSNIFLTTYNIRMCQNSLQELTCTLKELEERLLPKKKFGFKNKHKVQSNGVKGIGTNTIANGHEKALIGHDKVQNTHDKVLNGNDKALNGHDKALNCQDKALNGHDKALSSHDKALNGHDKALNGHDKILNVLSYDNKIHNEFTLIKEHNELNGHNKENISSLINGHAEKLNQATIITKERDEVDYKNILNDSFCGFKNRVGEIIELKRGETLKKDVTLANLENCTAKIFGSPSTLHMSNMKNCYVFCGPVTTSIFAENCENCTFVIACQQLRLHSSSSINVYLHVTSRAILEDCNGIYLAPYNLKYDGIEDDFHKSGLDLKRNHWNDVDDFNWLNTQKQSPNWGIMEDNKVMGSWDHMFSPT